MQQTTSTNIMMKKIKNDCGLKHIPFVHLHMCIEAD